MSRLEREQQRAAKDGIAAITALISKNKLSDKTLKAAVEQLVIDTTERERERVADEIASCLAPAEGGDYGEAIDLAKALERRLREGKP